MRWIYRQPGPSVVAAALVLCLGAGCPDSEDGKREDDIVVTPDVATDLSIPDAGSIDAPEPNDTGHDTTPGDPGGGDVPTAPDVPQGPGLGIDYDSTPPGAAPRYEPGAGDWTAIGWPSDRYLQEDGHVDLSNFPNSGSFELLDHYLEHGMEVLDGFSLNASIYFEIGGTPDMTALPTAAESLDAFAYAQLVNVTQDSPRYGEQHPLLFRWYEELSDGFAAPGTLAMRPVFGTPLAEGETYCAILTRALKDADGNYFQTPPGFVEDIDTAPWLAPLAAWLPDAQIRRDDIAVATCFTTQNATEELRRVRAFLELQDPPVIDTLAQPLTWGEFHGTYIAPNFQAGDKPYESDGDLRFDANGDPIVQELEEIRFMLLTPRDVEMPAEGWPVVLYAHGTGGDYESCWGVQDELRADGLAVICIDQPLHGPRSGGDEFDSNDLALYSFNFLNARSGRMSFRQSAIDTMTLARMVAAGSFDVPAEQTLSGQAVQLDGDRIYFFGHSHGGLSGALVLAVEPLVKAGVLSGAAGVMIETVLRRKDPVDIASLVRILIGAKEEDFDSFHPVATLVQLLVDATDPINYAPYWLAPKDGGTAKHVFVTSGTSDHASPAVGADAMAAAAGLPMLTPIAKVSEPHVLRGVPLQAPPVSLNAGEGENVQTAAFKQWQGGSHWVATSASELIAMWRTLFRTLVQGEPPVIGIGDLTPPQSAAFAASETCAGAQLVTGVSLPVQLPGDTSQAADDFSTGTCGGDDKGVGQRDVVYAFAPEVDGKYRFKLYRQPAPDEDTPQESPDLLYVVTDCTAISDTCLGRTGNNLDLELTAGTTVYAIIDGNDPIDRGPFTLQIEELCTWQDCGERECGVWGCGDCGSCAGGQLCDGDGQCVEGAVGDDCSEAIPVDVLPFSSSGTTADYTHDYGYANGDCPGFNAGYGNASADVAYLFTAPAEGRYEFELDTEYDGNLYVVGDCGDIPATCLGAQRTGGAERLLIDMADGESAYVIVDGASNSGNSHGPYTLHIDVCVPDCEGKACSDDGCGGSCGTCAAEDLCVDEPLCEPIPYICEGNATCEVLEPGDKCEIAIPIDALPFTASASTSPFHSLYGYSGGACPGEGSGYGKGSSDVAYAFTPDHEAIYYIKLSSTYDSNLYVVTDCHDIDGTCVEANENKGDDKNESMHVTLSQDVTYFIMVDGRSNSYNDRGSYQLQVSECIPNCEDKVCGGDGCGGSCGGACPAQTICANNGTCVPTPGLTCDDPWGVGKLPWSISRNTNDFNPVYTNDCAGEATGELSPDMSLSFKAPATGTFTFRVAASWDAMLYVVEDCADVAGTCLGHSHAAEPFDRLELELTNGQQVRVIVDGHSADAAVGGSFTLYVSQICFPQCDGKECGGDGCKGLCGVCTAPSDVCTPEQVCKAPAEYAGNACGAPFIVDESVLPLSGAGDTTGALNHFSFGTDQCPGVQGKGKGSADQVWQLTAPTGGSYRIEVVPDGWDAVVYVVEDCEAVASTCVAASDTQSVEALSVDLEADVPVYVIVDGVDNEQNDAGAYTISIGAE